MSGAAGYSGGLLFVSVHGAGRSYITSCHAANEKIAESARCGGKQKERGDGSKALPHVRDCAFFPVGV